MKIMQDQLPIETNKPADNPIRCYAWHIAWGKTGDRYIYFLEEDSIMIYKKGTWNKINEYQFLGEMSIAIPEINKFPLPMIKQIMETFKTLKPIQKSIVDFNNSNELNLINGMVDPLTSIIREHFHMDYSTLRLDYAFNASDQCPLWIKTIGEILEDDINRINLLQEFFGYCLTRDTTQHKALLLLGESRSGKSTILQTLRAMLGEKNCSSVPLKFISNPQYTPMLMNKLVNIDTDVSAKAAEFEAEFKTITSGEPVACNQKFVAAFDFVPYCKIVMAANIFPKITDHSSAFYKRLLLIPCDRVFNDKEQNRNLAKELNKELSGILNWSIEGLKRLKARGRFDDYDFMKDAVQELEDGNNPINLFMEEHLEKYIGSHIEKGDLYNKYKQWANETNNFPLSLARFSTCIYKKFNKETPKDARLTGGKRVWRNIRYIDFKSQPIKDIGWQNDKE